MLARDLQVRAKERHGALRVSAATGGEDLEVLLARKLEALQRLAEAGAEKAQARGVQGVMLADDLVALEIDQLLVELVVAVERGQADLPVVGKAPERVEGALHDTGDGVDLRRGRGRREVPHGVGLKEGPVV